MDKDELFSDQPVSRSSSPAPSEAPSASAPTPLGYTRDIGVFHDVETGIGANFTAYSLPDAIKPYYGQHPVGVNIFARVRLKPK